MRRPHSLLERPEGMLNSSFPDSHHLWCFAHDSGMELRRSSYQIGIFSEVGEDAFLTWNSDARYEAYSLGRYTPLGCGHIHGGLVIPASGLEAALAVKVVKRNRRLCAKFY